MLETLVNLFYGYCLIGALFGGYFMIWGAAHLDSEAVRMSWPVRLLLWPGSVALWPLLLRRLLQSRSLSTASKRKQP